MDALIRNLPWALPVVVVLLVGLAVLLWKLIQSRRVSRTAAAAAGPGAAPAGPQPVTVDFTGGDQAARLRSAFADGTRRLRAYSAQLGGTRVPWLLLCGERASGKSRLLLDGGLDLPLGVPEDADWHGCAWWFLDGGCVIESDADHLLRADGRGSDEAGWERLLGLLERHRPERPLDGLVLVVPCADLVGPPETEEDRRTVAERKASVVAMRLREAQRRLRLRFPVYVVVSGCERVPGFAAMFGALPPRRRDEIFGWSSPYAVDTAYQTGWVDEAYAALRGELETMQLELYADRARAADPEGVLLFPDELEATREPLRCYLDRLFKATAYHESIFLRGVYFSGAAADGRALFVKHLFERKVLPERTLARPGAATLVSRNRRVRMLQAGVVAGGLLLAAGTALSYFRLSRTERILHAFLDETARDVREVRAVRRGGQPLDEAALDDRMFRLFDSMAAIDINRYGSVFMPSSFLGPFNRRLRDAMRVDYEEIICRALLWRLNDRAVELTGAAAWLTEDAPRLSAVEDAPALDALRSYVRGLSDLERATERYNRLGTTGESDLNELGALVRYLFGRELPRAFFENSGIYRRALAEARYEPFDLEREHGTAARGEATRLLGLLETALYTRNLALQRVEELEARLDAVAAGTGGVGEVGQGEELRELLLAIDRAEQAFARPELARVLAPTFGLGPQFNEVLEAMSGSSVLGPPFADQARRRMQAAHANFHAALRHRESPYTGPLVETGAGRPRLAETVRMLEASLNDLLHQNFMAGEEALQFAAGLPPGTRLSWDLPLLERAADLYTPYQEFVGKGLALFPAGLRRPLQEVARVRLGRRIGDLVAQAQSFEPVPETASLPQLEREVADQVAALAAAHKPVARLLEVWSRLDMPAEREALDGLVDEQSAHTLAAVDRLLAEVEPYTPREGSFAWWDGSGALAVQAFELTGSEEIPIYLERQRERIAALARQYAAPVLVAAGRGGPRRTQAFRSAIARWEGILAQLDGYDRKAPGNSVAALETLVVTDLQALDLAACARAAALRGGGAGGGDFFARTAAGLRRAASERCRTLAGDQAVSGYARLERFFNQRLAGRFPFSLGLPGRMDPEADPEEVRAFFVLFDRYAGVLGDDHEGGGGVAPAAERLGAAGPAVRDFVARMREVRRFLAWFLDDPDRPRLPVYDLEVEFRTEREHERAGNQVLHWEMTAGDRRVTRRDADRHLRWWPGLPVAVGLGWARDAPVAPVAAQDGTVHGNVALYRYTNRWSLLALLRAHAAAVEDFDGAAEARPHTLRFTVETGPRAAAPQSNREGVRAVLQSTARVFLRVAVRQPQVAPEEGKPAPPRIELAMPDFPVRAPALDERTPSAAGGEAEDALALSKEVPGGR